MKTILLLSCAAATVLLLAHPRQPPAATTGPQPPSAALQEAMSSHGIETGFVPAAAAAGPDAGSVALVPVAYTEPAPR